MPDFERLRVGWNYSTVTLLYKPLFDTLDLYYLC